MRFLNELFSIWDYLTTVFGVYKVETIGDCYMVAGGLHGLEGADPTTGAGIGGHDPDHATKVMAFACAMVQSARQVKDPWGLPVKIRVGVHTGPCTSGIVGQIRPRLPVLSPVSPQCQAWRMS